MRLLELTIGQEDFAMWHGGRLVVLGFGLALGKTPRGFAIELYYLWLHATAPVVRIGDRYKILPWYRRLYVVELTWRAHPFLALRRWWAKCAWNADRLEDPFQ